MWQNFDGDVSDGGRLLPRGFCHGVGGQDISMVMGQLLKLKQKLKSHTDLKAVEMFSSSCIIYWFLFHLSPWLLLWKQPNHQLEQESEQVSQKNTWHTCVNVIKVLTDANGVSSGIGDIMQ